MVYIKSYDFNLFGEYRMTRDGTTVIFTPTITNPARDQREPVAVVDAITEDPNALTLRLHSIESSTMMSTDPTPFGVTCDELQADYAAELERQRQQRLQEARSVAGVIEHARTHRGPTLDIPIQGRRQIEPRLSRSIADKYLLRDGDVPPPPPPPPAAGGKRKSRRTRKSKKSRKGKTQKKRRQSTRRRR